jgi:hypothetical protein
VFIAKSVGIRGKEFIFSKRKEILNRKKVALKQIERLERLFKSDDDSFIMKIRNTYCLLLFRNIFSHSY